MLALAIEARGLCKTYRGWFRSTGHEALVDLDLAIASGAAFGLIGPNGAGKTTFIKALLGVLRPTRGLVRVLGQSPDDPATRARIGYLPERLHLPASFTPLRFLEGVARLKGLSDISHEARHALTRVGLAGDASRRIGGFSKGMRQRLGLAAALLGKPLLLILDEPTDGVDPMGRVEIRTILAEERARGATLFLNSHLLSETERICDRIGILAGGRLVREGPLEALSGSDTRHRLRFAPGSDPEALRAAGLTPTPDPDVFLADTPDPLTLNTLLDRARATGALLVELRPDLRDLEQVLTDALTPPPSSRRSP
ncbi:ABC transporter ATP-binding protein [Chondromyces apiculatus]|uniref:Nitrous oxide reductase maturation protein NosF (ATPase) n=1 Tax=Chondromyces apiculatus DSM 436 TaxID=1192034 RepID=A0A017SW47_9BACT|nr:ABC transporter ATP-binding protein [Chondromyces apiculatus]EYF01208.1 Nitrous oxide reductase maturation protein NosF (ATPase) [Chondromyces apiculatus DSM 436]